MLNYDRFKNIEFCNKGFSSKLYKAYDEIEDRNVILKYTSGKYVFNNCQIEGKILDHLSNDNHNYTCKYYGLTQNPDGKTFIVMEYIEGTTLNDFIQKTQYLDYNDKLDICMNLINGLIYIHEKNIIHQDINSCNIMIDNNYRIVYIDFGMAIFLKVDKSKSQPFKNHEFQRIIPIILNVFNINSNNNEEVEDYTIYVLVGVSLLFFIVGIMIGIICISRNISDCDKFNY